MRVVHPPLLLMTTSRMLKKLLEIRPHQRHQRDSRVSSHFDGTTQHSLANVLDMKSVNARHVPNDLNPLQ